MIDTGTRPPDVVPGSTMFVRLFSVLRVFRGLVWLTNALAKVFEKSNYDW